MAEISTDNKQQPIILHGDLDLYIIEARSLPNMDMVSTRIKSCFSTCNCTTTTTKSAASTVVPQTTLARNKNGKKTMKPWTPQYLKQ